MKRTDVYLPEVEKMYDATLLQILPDYGFGNKKLGHAVVTEGGKTLRMSGYPAISEKGIVGKGDMGIQTTQALELVKLTVERAGGTFDDIIHFIFYFTDRKEFHEKALPARWKFFKKHSRKGFAPCITSIGVTGLMHPDMMIEVEATAVFD
jgi:enamine deaminase RidA (YjgF/YER057c/UK114 family)